MNTPPRAIIKAFPLGPFATNTYIVHHEGFTDCWIIDPSFGPAPAIAYIKQHNLVPQAIVLTHAHIDHIAGLADVQKTLGPLPVLLHEAERTWLQDPELNLSNDFGQPLILPAPTQLLTSNQTLSLSNQPWQLFHTPGHTPGSITLYHAPTSAAISGDVLFAGSIGRADFPGSDFNTLAHSIRTHLYTLPDATTIHPGHGPTTTIATEKRSNPYVRP